MTSLRVSSQHEPLSSSSQPSSPFEEDLGRPSSWGDADTSTLVSSESKGKGKARMVTDDDDDDDDDDSETIIEESVQQVPSSYPPLDEEAIETRRIEENLRRLAAVERDRRKRLRGSRSNISNTHEPSLLARSFSVTEVSQRANGLWNRWEKNRTGGTKLQRLGSVDESLPLETTHSATTKDLPTGTSNFDPASSTTSLQTDPFEDPRYTVQENVESIPIDALSPEAPLEPSSQRRKQSPPRPLGLPDPISPSPHEDEQRTSQQEVPIRHRWWTDWLCGCREEDDEQAGRTNPME